MVGLWTLGKVCAMVSAMKCVNLAIHRPVLLGLIITLYVNEKILKKIFLMHKRDWKMVLDAVRCLKDQADNGSK